MVAASVIYGYHLYRSPANYHTSVKREPVIRNWFSTKAARIRHKLEIMAAHKCENDEIYLDYQAGVAHVQKEHGKIWRRRERNTHELFQIAKESADIIKDASLAHYEMMTTYRLLQAKERANARLHAAAIIYDAEDIFDSSVDLAKQKLDTAWSAFIKKAEADLDVESEYKAIEKATVVRDQAEDAALWINQFSVAKANDLLELTLAASEQFAQQVVQADDNYHGALLTTYKNFAEHKRELFKGNLADSAIDEAGRLLIDKRDAALSAAKLSRDNSLNEIVFAKMECMDKTVTSFDSILAATLDSVYDLI